MKKLLLFLLALAAAFAASAQIRVVKTSGNGIGVDATALTASGGAAAATALEAFNRDLARAGAMKPVPKGQGAVTLSGGAAAVGGSVRFTLRADRAGQTVLNSAFAAPAASAHQAGNQAADALYRALTGKPSFFLSQVAFIGAAGKAKELYLSDASGLAVRQLTHDRTIAVKPRFSFDNRLISYTSYLRRFPDVYSIDLASGARKVLSQYPGLNSGGAFSPDGRSVALILSKDGNPDLYVKDLASGRLRRLTNTRRVTEGSPCFSPDGRSIVYVSDAGGTYQLYVISAEGGAARRLTTPAMGSQNVSPDWGSAGIACQSLVGGRFQIAVVDPATGASQIVTKYDAAYEDPSWAPDGRHILASRSAGGATGLYLLDTQGDPPVKFTDAPGTWTMPAWTH
jgi:TolB protein